MTARRRATPWASACLSQQLFDIERDALKAAFQSAPEILFVAGARNEDNSADFVEYIPAAFELPPGRRARLKLSGTSMAAPQVTNLAAKLFALDPKLGATQAKAMNLAGADRKGRVNLINPKATIARLGLNASAQ